MLPRDIDNKADTSRGNLNVDCLERKNRPGAVLDNLTGLVSLV